MKKDVYEVTVDLHIQAKILTRAISEDSAYNNIQTDYEESTTEEFLENYDWEVKDFEMDYAEIKEEM